MSRPPKSTMDPAILTAALEGLELQKRRIEEQISSVRSMLGMRSASNYSTANTPASSPSESTGGRRKRNLSAEAREAIAAAQRKRWAAFRKNKG